MENDLRRMENKGSKHIRVEDRGEGGYMGCNRRWVRGDWMGTMISMQTKIVVEMNYYVSKIKVSVT